MKTTEFKDLILLSLFSENAGRMLTFDVNLVEGVVDGPDDPQDDLHALLQLELAAAPVVRAAQVIE